MNLLIFSLALLYQISEKKQHPKCALFIIVPHQSDCKADMRNLLLCLPCCHSSFFHWQILDEHAIIAVSTLSALTAMHFRSKSNNCILENFLLMEVMTQYETMHGFCQPAPPPEKNNRADTGYWPHDRWGRTMRGHPLSDQRLKICASRLRKGRALFYLPSISHTGFSRLYFFLPKNIHRLLRYFLCLSTPFHQNTYSHSVS